VRLFVALEIPTAIRANLTAFMDHLRSLRAGPGTPKIRWTRTENLHVTLKFIGSVVPEKLAGIRAALEHVGSERPVELRFRGIGFFPGGKRPRVIWAGVAGSRNLGGLAADIDGALAKLGVPGQDRAFIPHLTLARCEPGAISAELRACIQKESLQEFGTLLTSEFHLIESQLKPSGAEYTTLQSFEFAAEA
jgi:RNA 2',3'-cyclic 3'-phosphodiesterase